MAEPKTKPSNSSVKRYLAGIEDPIQRADAVLLQKIMRRATNCRARLWGTSIVGFGSYHYVYASGREGDWMLTGFSPRKRALSIYIMPGFAAFQAHLDRLGKFKTARSCVYVKRLDDVDVDVLESLIHDSVEWMRSRYPSK